MSFISKARCLHPCSPSYGSRCTTCQLGVLTHTHAQILHVLRSGYRLERPRGCPLELWGLVQSCWRDEPRERPTFTTITTTLRNWREAYVSSRVALRGAAAAYLGAVESVAISGASASPAASLAPGGPKATAIGQRAGVPTPTALEPASPRTVAAVAAAKSAAARMLLNTAGGLPVDGREATSRGGSREPGLATSSVAASPPVAAAASYPALPSSAPRVARVVLGAHASGFPVRPAEPAASGTGGTGDGVATPTTARNTNAIASCVMHTHMSFEVGEPPIMPAYTSGSSAAFTSAAVSRASRELPFSNSAGGTGDSGAHPALAASAVSGQGVLSIPQPYLPHRDSPTHVSSSRGPGGPTAAIKRRGTSSTGELQLQSAVAAAVATAATAGTGASSGPTFGRGSRESPLASGAVSSRGQGPAHYGRRMVRKTHSSTAVAAPSAAVGAAGASAGAAVSGGAAAGTGGLPGWRMAASLEEVEARLPPSMQPSSGAQVRSLNCCVAISRKPVARWMFASQGATQRPGPLHATSHLKP